MAFASACTWDFSHSSGTAFGTGLWVPEQKRCVVSLCCWVTIRCRCCWCRVLFWTCIAPSALVGVMKRKHSSGFWVPCSPKSVMDIENTRMCCRKIQTYGACVIFPFCTFLGVSLRCLHWLSTDVYEGVCCLFPTRNGMIQWCKGLCRLQWSLFWRLSEPCLVTTLAQFLILKLNFNVPSMSDSHSSKSFCFKTNCS